MTDQKENKIEAIAREPSKLKKGLKIAGLVLSILAGSVIAAGASGVPLPPLVTNIAKLVLEIGKQADQLPAPEPELK